MNTSDTYIIKFYSLSHNHTPRLFIYVCALCTCVCAYTQANSWKLYSVKNEKFKRRKMHLLFCTMTFDRYGELQPILGFILMARHGTSMHTQTFRQKATEFIHSTKEVTQTFFFSSFHPHISIVENAQ